MAAWQTKTWAAVGVVLALGCAGGYLLWAGWRKADAESPRATPRPQAAPNARDRFDSLSAAYARGDAAKRGEVSKAMRSLYEELALSVFAEPPEGAAAEAAVRPSAGVMALVCMWFALDEMPRPAASEIDEWLAQSARAARRGGNPDYAVQIEIERVKLWMDRNRFDRAEAVLDECREEAEHAPRFGGVLYWIYRCKLSLRHDLEAAQESLREAEKALARLDETWAHEDRSRLERARSWVCGQQVETWMSAGLLDRAYLAQRAELKAATLWGAPSAILQADRHAIQLALAAFRPESASRLCDRYLADANLAPLLRAWFLGCRAVSLKMRTGRDPELMRDALADLDRMFALGVLRGGQLAAWRIRQADYLARAGREEEARTTLSDLDAADIGKLTPREQGYFQGLRSHLRWDSEDEDGRARLRADLEETFERFLSAWRRTPQDAAVSYLEYGQYRMLVGELVRARLRGSPRGAATDHALRAVLQVQAMSSLARRHRCGTMSIDDLRSTLRPANGGILLYSFSRERCHVFAIDERPVECVEIAAGDVLIRRANDHFKRCLRNPAMRAQATEASREVADLLLPGAIRKLVRRWKAVTVVGLDELGHVPFAWLPLHDGSRVFETSAVAHLPSIPAGMIAASPGRERPAAPTELGIQVVTAPEPAPALAEQRDLTPFPTEDHEARWKEWLAPSAVRVVHGPEATYGCLRDPEIERMRALVVVCHGVVERDGVALVCSPGGGHDGVIRARDFRALASGAGGRALPPLVVLYCCNSSRAPVRRGEFGSHDLAGAMLEAGARAVVLSQDVLTYRFVQRFAKAFHAELREPDATVASALRQVQIRFSADERSPVEPPPGAATPGAAALESLHVVGLAHLPWQLPR